MIFEKFEDLNNRGLEEIVLGIELGTINSAACVCKGDEFIMIPSAEGFSKYGKPFPSYVAFTEDGEEFVGEPAKRQYANNKKGTIVGIKRHMGTDYKMKIFGKEYTPEVILAKILQKIKIDTEEFLGEEIDKAVITVPANFNDNQRSSTKDAAEIAGFNVSRLISEPVAACVAYGFDNETEEEITILVFDLGGGTLDVTIIEVDGNYFDVVSTSHNHFLGGNDINDVLSEYIADEFEKEYGINILKEKGAELNMAAEIAKIELSTEEETQINLPYLILDSNYNYISFETKLTRTKFESLVKPLVNECGKTIKEALDGAYKSKNDIDNVILVGVATRIPIVQKFVEDFIGKPVERGIDPEECVVIGAAKIGQRSWIDY